MKKKLLVIFLLIVAATLLAIFFPWNVFSDIKQRIIGGKDAYSSLKVYSLAGSLKVYIDGAEKGTAKQDESFLEVIPVSAGEHEVVLKRESTSEGFYEDFKQTISFEKGFDTTISYEVGPSDDSSSGWMLWARKAQTDAGHTLVNVSCNTQDCNVSIDEEKVESPVSKKKLSLDSQHKFIVSSDGYQDLEFVILPENAEDRSKVEGYELFVDVNLYHLPI